MREENLERFIEPIMIDPSILISKRYLYNLFDFKGRLYVPNSFIEMLKDAKFEERWSPDYNFYSGYLSHELLADTEFIESLLKKLEVSTFSKKHFKKPSPQTELVMSKVEELYLPPYVREILKEEIAFLFSHSGLISRLKKPFEMMARADLPIIDITRSVPEDWKYTVKGMKRFCNWIGFLADFSVNLIPPVNVLSRIVGGVRMYIIDP